MKAPTRFPGIARHARILGIHQSHLYRCLAGQRRLKEALQKRYDALIEGEKSGFSEEALPFEECLVLHTPHLNPETIKEYWDQFGDAVAFKGDKLLFDASRVHLTIRIKGKLHFGHGPTHPETPDFGAHAHARKVTRKPE